MNQHLQLFRFFNENEQTIYIEKNLTRAFALCLKYDSNLLYSFLKSWLTKEDFISLLSNPPEEAEITVNIEVETKELVENTRKLYAIGLTESTKNLNWNDILQDALGVDKSNYTDIAIIVVLVLVSHSFGILEKGM